MIVGTTALAANVPNTARLAVYNFGPGNAFMGDSTVTAGTGYQVVPGNTFMFPRPLNQSGIGSLFLIADQANTDVRFLLV